MKTEKLRRALGFALGTAMIFALVPASAMAEETGKAIQLVENGSAPNIKGGQESYVYYGNYKQTSDGNGGYNVDTVKWRVLDNKDGKLFLLSDMSLDSNVYHTDWEAVTWERSTIRSWLNGYDESENSGGEGGLNYEKNNFLNKAFSMEEQSAIAVTDVVNDDNPDYETDGGNDTKDKIFLLSIAEVTNEAYGFTNNYDATDTRTFIPTDYASRYYNNGLWLRSPGEMEMCVSFVSRDGALQFLEPSCFDFFAVRPAFNLDLDAVLFTSAAFLGKASVGLEEVGSYGGTDWEMTLLDSSRNFKASCQSTDGDIWTIKYSGAETGANEYISAIIADSGGAVAYYGKIEAVSSASGTVEIDVSCKMNDGDTLYVFNEQANGDYKTDYSSALQEISEGGGEAPSEYLTGDVNSDNAVDAKDKAILNRYLAGWDGYEDRILNRDAADIDGDGNINARDKAILNRYLAGWNGYDEYFEK